MTPRGPLSCPFPILCSSAPIWGTKSQRFRVEGHSLQNIQQQRGPEGSWESTPYCASKPRRLHSHGFWLLKQLGELRATSSWFSPGRSLGFWVAFRNGTKESFSPSCSDLSAGYNLGYKHNHACFSFLSYSRHGGQEVWGLRTLTTQLKCWVALGRMAFRAG